MLTSSPTVKLLLNLPPFPHDYLFEFCSVCAREYVSGPKRENRFSTLPETLRSMFWLSPDYQAFAGNLSLQAEKEGCSPQSQTTDDRLSPFAHPRGLCIGGNT